MAVTGPFTTYDNRAGQRAGRDRYRLTTKPYLQPLPYWHYRYNSVYTDESGAVSPGVNEGSRILRFCVGPFPDRNSSLAYLKGYDAFVRRMTDDRASLGITIAESRQSLSMISGRTGQLIAALSGLKSRNFSQLANAFGFQKGSGKYKRASKLWDAQAHTPKQIASNYLEYIFGWQPMVQDIYNAAKVLSSTPKTVSLTGSGTDHVLYDKSTYENTTLFTEDYDLTLRVKFGGVVFIDNPNLDLANRMGLVNPAQILYNVIPASFLLDWFLPVSRFLERYTDFVGRSLHNGYISTKVTASGGVAYNVFHSGSYHKWNFREAGENFYRETVSSFPVPRAFPMARLPVKDLLGRAQSLTALFIQNYGGRN